MQSTVGVDRKIAAQFEPPALHEILHLAALAETERLDLQQHHVTETVVDFREVEIATFDTGHLERLGRREAEPNGEWIGTRWNIIGRIRMAFGDAGNINRPLLQIL